MKNGFTLLEMAVVLTIVGLLAGGIMVGISLVSNAAVQAQIVQINKYQSAVKTFEEKYGALPGDMIAKIATKYGFSPRGPYIGQGDGNGVLECNWANSNTPGSANGQCQMSGETGLFWVDLTYANGLNVNLIDGSFNKVTATSLLSTSVTNMGAYLPEAKIGRGNYINVWSGGVLANGWTGVPGDNINYFGILSISSLYNDGSCINCYRSSPGLTVSQAYGIDSKVDDGLPQSGNVLAISVAPVAGYWGKWYGAASSTNGPTTVATAGSSTTCYDNGGVVGTQLYSLTQHNGDGVNCALSFKFQ